MLVAFTDWVLTAELADEVEKLPLDSQIQLVSQIAEIQQRFREDQREAVRESRRPRKVKIAWKHDGIQIIAKSVRMNLLPVPIEREYAFEQPGRLVLGQNVRRAGAMWAHFGRRFVVYDLDASS